MKHIVFLLICTCAFFVGCTSKSEDIFTIDIDSLREEEPLFELEVNRYIPLETRDDILIGFIKKIEYHDGMFYVLDYDSNKIYIFDNEGKHYFTLSRQGRGPGEYVGVDDFALDEEKNLYVLCINTAKIIKYAYPDYSFDSTMTLDRPVNEICWQDGILWAANCIAGTRYLDGLTQITEEGRVNIIIPAREQFDDAVFNHDYKAMSFYNGKNLLFNQRMSPDVYCLKDETAEKMFRIKSEYMVSDENYTSEDEKIFGFHSVFQTDGYVVGVLWAQNLHLYDILVYEPTTGKASLIPDDKNVIGYDLCSADGNYFLSYTTPESIIESEDKDAKHTEIAEQLSPADNPVIVKFSVHGI